MYKFKSWWQHLGLVLLGIFFIKMFNLWATFYLFLGFCLLSFSHSLDDRKKSFVFYGIIIISLSLFVNLYQKLLICFIVFLCFLYDKAKDYPISAFYKGFGYSLLFFIPFTKFVFDSLPFYFLISTIATISELFHETNHFEQDLKEGRKTTPILLNLKTDNKTRRKAKFGAMFLGGLIALAFLLR